jgi:hypothetical protein
MLERLVKTDLRASLGRIDFMFLILIHKLNYGFVFGLWAKNWIPLVKRPRGNAFEAQGDADRDAPPTTRACLSVRLNKVLKESCLIMIIRFSHSMNRHYFTIKLCL